MKSILFVKKKNSNWKWNFYKNNLIFYYNKTHFDWKLFCLETHIALQVFMRMQHIRLSLKCKNKKNFRQSLDCHLIEKRINHLKQMRHLWLHSLCQHWILKISNKINYISIYIVELDRLMESHLRPPWEDSFELSKLFFKSITLTS